MERYDDEDFRELYERAKEELFMNFENNLDPTLSLNENIKVLVDEIYDAVEAFKEELKDTLDEIRRLDQQFDDDDLEDLREQVDDLRLQIRVFTRIIRDLEAQA